MGIYVDIDGHATWVEEGAGGVVRRPCSSCTVGLSDSSLLLDSMGDALATTRRVVAFDRRGHGATADTAEPFHYDDMATETIGVLDTVVGGPAHLVGWSDGGIVALLVALRRPDLVGKLVPIGANFHYDGLAPISLDPDSPLAAMIAQAYGERSPDGADHFPVVLGKAMTLFASEPTLTTDDLGHRRADPGPVGRRRRRPPRPHLRDVPGPAGGAAGGRAGVVPRRTDRKPADVARLVVELLSSGPPETFMPILRAPSTS